MKQAYPRSGVYKASGAIKVDDGAPGMDLRERYLACCLEGLAASLVGLAKPLSVQQIEDLVGTIEKIVERLLEAPA